MPPAAILDIDGTLVHTNFQHALAWYRAFHQLELVLPVWRIHRHIGMGGDHLVKALCGEQVEDEKGDDIRAAEKVLYAELIGEVDHYLELLDARELADGWTTAADVEATKPEPDLVQAAVEKAGGGEAVMVGDSTWDCEAGAVAVHDSIEDLRESLDETPLAAS